MNDDLPSTILRSRPMAETASMTPPAPGADNYNVGKEIARGGMASILEAGDTKLKRTVAIKVMNLAAESHGLAQQRFLREAEVLAMLAHPNIVPIYDIVWEDGVPLFYSMKMVKGRTLQTILDDLRNEEPEALREFTLDRLLLIFRKVCDAISFAHSKGVLHRDLKPDNVMVGEFGEVLVMDWGLAKAVRSSQFPVPAFDETDAQDGQGTGSCELRTISQTLQGSVMGTPKYMSPEQAMGMIDELDERSDIFSLGGILYAILTLRPPVEGATLAEVLEKVRTGGIAPPSTFGGAKTTRIPSQKGGVLAAKYIHPLPHIRAGRVPGALCSVVMRALALEKEDRYVSVVAFAADIEAYENGFATKAEQAGTMRQIKLLILRHRTVTAALAALLMISAGFVLKVMASEREAKRNAEIALLNEGRANASAADARRALARAQISLAQAALRSLDSLALAQALDAVPEDLRDDSWRYFSQRANRSLLRLALPADELPHKILALPGEDDCFLLASIGRHLKVVGARQGNTLRTLDTGIAGTKLCAISGDGRVLAIGAANGKEVKLMEARGGGLIRSLPGINGLYFLALNADGSLLLESTVIVDSPYLNKWTTRLIETRTGTVRWSRELCVQQADFHPAGDRLIISSSGSQRHLIIVNVENGREMAILPDISIRSQALSPDGRLVAIGDTSGVLRLVDAASGQILRERELYPAAIVGIAWTRSGKLLTIGDQGLDQEGRWVIRLWSIPDFISLDTMLGLESSRLPPAWALCPATGGLLTSWMQTQYWRLAVDQEKLVIKEATEQGWSNCFLSDDILLARDHHGLAPYDLSRTGTAMKQPFPLPPKRFNACATTLQRHLLAVAAGTSGPDEIHIYSHDNGRLTERHHWPLKSLAGPMSMDPGAERIAITGKFGRPATVIEVATGQTLLTLPATFTSLVFAGPDGDLIAVHPERDTATRSEFDLIRLEGKSGRTLQSLRVLHRIGALAASPDRSLIAIGGSDHHVRIFDAATLEEKLAFRAHDADVTTLEFHPTLPVIATGSLDRSVRLWEYQPMPRLIQDFHGLGGTPVTLAINPSGTLLAVDGQERAFRVFEIQRKESASIRE